jgi:hypothetical protein
MLRSTVLFLIVILLFYSCKKDPAIIPSNNVYAHTDWFDSVFSAYGTATIDGGDLIISAQMATAGPSTYIYYRDIKMKLKLQGHSFAEKKTYLLYNDSAQYGKGTFAFHTSEGDAYSNHGYTTGYYHGSGGGWDSSQVVMGFVKIERIRGNKISGSFYFNTYEVPSGLHPTQGPGFEIREGIFENVKVD